MTPKKKKIKRKQWIGLVFIAPWLIGLIGLQVYPFVASLFYLLMCDKEVIEV